MDSKEIAIYKLFFRYQTLISFLLVIILSITLITLIIENNFYKKKEDIKNVTSVSTENNLVEMAENKTSHKTDTEQIVEKIKPIEEATEIVGSKKELGTETIEKILKDREAQVIENAKSNESKTIQKETPEIISLIIAKIISDEKTDNENLVFDSYEEKIWNSKSMGCPVNGMNYVQVITSGYKLNIIKNKEKEEYHADLNGNYINCTEILKSNLNANYNFFEKFNLSETTSIQVSLNESSKELANIVDKEKVKDITNGLNLNINVTKSESCNPKFKLVFSKKDSFTEFLIFCDENPYYVFTDENINANKTMLGIIEPILSEIEFPGMPK